MRHEDDSDAWPVVTVLENPCKEDMIAHLKEVHGEVWKAMVQGVNGEEGEEE